MRTRVLLAIPAAAALVIAAPLAAYAADLSWIVGGGTKDWGDTTNWASHTTPANTGDSLTFATSGTDLTNNNYLDISVKKLTFDVANPFQVVGNDIEIDAGAATDGIQVDNGDIDISPLIQTTGDQTVRVASGASLTFPSEFDVLSDTVTFDVAEDGLVTFGPASRLDGIGGAGEVVKTGPGILAIGGGTGEIGGGGLQVQQGSVHLTGDGTGTPWVLDGGVISGDGEMERLAAIEGRLAPSDDYFGVGIGTLEIWNLFIATADTLLDLQLQADGTNDAFYTLEGTQIDGAMLALDIEPGTVAGTQWTILEQEREVGPAYFWNFTTPDGTPIVEGEPFVYFGGLFTLETVERTVVVTYLGEDVTPVVPTAPALPATGLDAATAIPSIVIAGGALILGAGALLLVRRVRRSS